jgi:hypothetical protein
LGFPNPARHPASVTSPIQTAGCVIGELFDEGKIAPEYCKEALRREIRWNNNALGKTILEAEGRAKLKAPPSTTVPDASNTDFPKVAELFKVIDANTATVLSPQSCRNSFFGENGGGETSYRNTACRFGAGVLMILGLRNFPGFQDYIAGLSSTAAFSVIWPGCYRSLKLQAGNQ